MKAHEILSHIVLAQALVLTTYFGLDRMQEHGGYFAQLLCVGAPFILGLQIMLIFTTDKE